MEALEKRIEELTEQLSQGRKSSTLEDDISSMDPDDLPGQLKATHEKLENALANLKKTKNSVNERNQEVIGLNKKLTACQKDNKAL